MGVIPVIQGYFNIWISANMPNLINKFKNKNYYIISTCTEKAFQKLNILMLILNKVGMEEIYLNIINAKHDQLSQYHNQHWKVKSILRLETKQECAFVPLLFNIVLKVLAAEIKQGKEIKEI